MITARSHQPVKATIEKKMKEYIAGLFPPNHNEKAVINRINAGVGTHNKKFLNGIKTQTFRNHLNQLVVAWMGSRSRNPFIRTSISFPIEKSCFLVI